MRTDRLRSKEAAVAGCTVANEAEAGLSIADLANEFGVTHRTLQFYEARGFLAPRRHGSRREYSGDDRRRIALILQAKRLGFTLREIGEMLASEGHCGHALTLSRQQCTEQINLLERQKRAIETALTELRRLYSSHYLRALARSDGGTD